MAPLLPFKQPKTNLNTLQPNQTAQLQVQPGQLNSFMPGTSQNIPPTGGDSVRLPLGPEAPQPGQPLPGQQLPGQQLPGVPQELQRIPQAPQQPGILPQVQQAATGLLQAPAPQLDIPGELEGFQRQSANALEALRQQSAGLTGGTRIQELLPVVLEQRAQEAALRRGLTRENQELARQAQMDAINAGLAVATAQEPGLQRQAVERQAALDRIANLFSQGRSIEAQKELAQLQVQAGQLEQERGIEAEQALQTQRIEAQERLTKIDNDIRLALQQGDIASAERLQAERIEADKELQKLAGAQRIEELNTQQAFVAAQNDLNRSNEVFLNTQNIEGRAALAELQGKIDSNQLMQQQDFAKLINEIEFEQSQALSTQDFNQVAELERIKGTISQVAQAAQNEFIDSQRIATQDWQTGERLSEQSFEKGMMYYQSELNKAAAEGDFSRQKELQNLQNEFQLARDTNNMTFQEKLLYTQSKIDEAQAQNNLFREMDLLRFQNKLTLQRDKEQFGNEYALQELQSSLRRAEANNDFANQQVLQKLQFDFTAEQAVEDRALEQARIAIAQQGQDFNEFLGLYEQIKDANPDQAVQFLNSELKDAGMKAVMSYDAQEATKNAIEAEFAAMRAQFAQTHPEFVDRAAGDLNEDGIKAFNEWANKNIYGDANVINDVITGVTNVLSLDEEQKAEIVSQADTWNPVVKTDGRGWWRPDVRTISNAPSKGSFFNFGGGTFQATSGLAEETRGQNYQYFTAINLENGESVTIRANDNGRITFS